MDYKSLGLKCGIEIHQQLKGRKLFSNIDSKLNFTFNKFQERNVRVALSNTFGFGGHNACLVFKKFD